MLAFLGPLIATNVLQALSGTLNNIYLGRLLGTEALAAAVAFLPLLMLLIALVIGLGTGASILAGRAWGARDAAQLRRIAGTALLGSVLLGVAVAVLGFATIVPVLRGLRTPEAVLPQATAYARVMLLALPVMFPSIVAASLLRGTGDTVSPLRALLVTTAATMALTPALIQGWAGLPRLGVASAAWAFLLGQSASLGWLAWHLGRRDHVLAWRQVRPHLRWDAPVLWQVARLGVPTGLFFITGSVADLALLSIINAHGLQATAAWGAVNQVMNYVQFPAVSIAIATSVFAAQAIGAGRLEQLDEVTRVGLALNGALTGGLALAVAVLAPWAVGLFVPDAPVVRLAADVLRITAVGSVVFGMASVFSGVMRASGTVRVPMLISLGCLAMLLVPLGWTFDRLLGLRWIWLAYPVTYGVALVLQAAYFFGVWKRRPLAQLV
jgi:putative MATE family efflux protein